MDSDVCDLVECYICDRLYGFGAEKRGVLVWLLWFLEDLDNFDDYCRVRSG